MGHLRLATPPPPPPHRQPPADAPVVLFVPAFDEEASVAAVVTRVPDKVCGRRVCVLVVDDGSTDATAERARAAGAVIVTSPHNEGLGAAVRRGLHYAVDELGAAAVAFCDADGEYAPEELERLVQPVLDGVADYVVGSRFAGDIERMLPHRRLGNVVLTRALRVCARTPITDGQSGYRAFSADAARAAEIIHDYNYAQVLTLDLLAKGFRYREVPITLPLPHRGAILRPPRPLPAERAARRVPRAERANARELVLHDERGEPVALALPSFGIEAAVHTERVRSRPTHVHHVVQVVGHEQALAPERGDARSRTRPRVDQRKARRRRRCVERVHGRQSPHVDRDDPRPRQPDPHQVVRDASAEVVRIRGPGRVADRAGHLHAQHRAITRIGTVAVVLRFGNPRQGDRRIGHVVRVVRRVLRLVEDEVHEHHRGCCRRHAAATTGKSTSSLAATRRGSGAVQSTRSARSSATDSTGVPRSMRAPAATAASARRSTIWP